MTAKEVEYPVEAEAYLSSLEHAPKPWFLSSSVIFRLVKQAAGSIPMSALVFEQSINGIATLTKFINEKTNANIVVLDQEKVQDLINHLDGVISDQFIRLDDGLDHLRSKLGSVLRKLIVSLIDQKKLVQAFLLKKKEETKDISDAALALIKTRYEQAVDVLNALLTAVRNKYPEAYDRACVAVTKSYEEAEVKTQEVIEFVGGKSQEVKDYVDVTAESVKTTCSGWLGSGFKLIDQADVRVLTYSAFLLKTAQPYVHSAVTVTSPFLATAVEVSQPYVVRARPYVDPLVQKAQGYNHALQENKLVGPYVVRALETATLVFEEAKTYCSTSPPGTPADVEASATGTDTAAAAGATIAAAGTTAPGGIAAAVGNVYAAAVGSVAGFGREDVGVSVPLTDVGSESD